MAPPFSSSNYDTIFSLTINSSNIINGTITGSDIANGTITDANIAVGTITEAKLSSALQTKLADFDTRLTALETPPPPSGWSGTITFNRTAGGGIQYIYLRTNTGVIANGQQYIGAIAFSVSLSNAQSYVEIALDYEGYWELNTVALEPYVATPYVYYEAGLTWNRYNILPNIQSNLAFNYTTFYND